MLQFMGSFADLPAATGETKACGAQVSTVEPTDQQAKIGRASCRERV